jgi:hypothetical protein
MMTGQMPLFPNLLTEQDYLEVVEAIKNGYRAISALDILTSNWAYKGRPTTQYDKERVAELMIGDNDEDNTGAGDFGC